MMRRHQWTWAERRIVTATLIAVLWLAAWPARAEDGYDLWLRYRPLPAAQAAVYRAQATQLSRHLQARLDIN